MNAASSARVPPIPKSAGLRMTKRKRPLTILRDVQDGIIICTKFEIARHCRPFEERQRYLREFVELCIRKCTQVATLEVWGVSGAEAKASKYSNHENVVDEGG